MTDVERPFAADAGRSRATDRGPSGARPAAEPATETIAASAPSAPVGFYHGDDTYGLERAALALGSRVAGPDGPPLRVERILGSVKRTADADERASAILERVATASLFGDGTLVVVADAPGLARFADAAAALTQAVSLVAPGNALALLALADESGRIPAAAEPLKRAVTAAGGEVRWFAIPAPQRFAAWIGTIAPEIGVHVGGPVAHELARRLGALEPGRDIDRRGLAAQAVAELRKLALYRPDGVVTVDDVRALVNERVPTSMFRLIDAIGERRAREAVVLVERATEAVPGPVLVARLHRRIRELIATLDLTDRGRRGPEIAKSLGISGQHAEFRVGLLQGQARRWTVPELTAALDALVELDARMKGERSSNERAQRLELALWVVERVATR